MDEIPVVSDKDATQELPHVHDDVSSLANYFDVKPDEQSDRLKELASYLRNGKTEYSSFDMMRDLRDLMFKLGTPPIGTTQFDHAYSYAKLNGAIRSMEEQRVRMER